MRKHYPYKNIIILYYKAFKNSTVIFRKTNIKA